MLAFVFNKIDLAEAPLKVPISITLEAFIKLTIKGKIL